MFDQAIRVEEVLLTLSFKILNHNMIFPSSYFRAILEVDILAFASGFGFNELCPPEILSSYGSDDRMILYYVICAKLAEKF